MTAAAVPASQAAPQVLDPVSRATEVLFGLIMVLTFTASLNAGEAGRNDIRLMLVAALGCNLAWGVIDAAMYLIAARAEKEISFRTVAQVRDARTPAEADRVIAAALPPAVAAALDREGMERIRLQLRSLPLPARPGLSAEDKRGAVAVFLLVFVATLPVVLPFLVIGDPQLALRVSHAVAIGSMFLAGCALGRQWGRPWRTGLALVAVGVAMVAVALLLGG